MRSKGLEPSFPLRSQHLKLMRLPIPPRPPEAHNIEFYFLPMQQFYLRPGWQKNISVSVGATIEICENSVSVDFGIREPKSCFCQSKEKDGTAVCEDSCVEVFLRMMDNSNEYANFEFNSKGVCYAARGKDRENRTELSKEEYAQIKRKPSGVSIEKDFYRWNLSIEIPLALLGVKNLKVFQLDGNLYKCADKATEPHWLCAFPINTPNPDFHRPECFSCLNPNLFGSSADDSIFSRIRDRD